LIEAGNVVLVYQRDYDLVLKIKIISFHWQKSSIYQQPT